MHATWGLEPPYRVCDTHLYAQDFEVQSHEIFASAACDPLPHQWLDDGESYYILYPNQPFDSGTEYRVRITGTQDKTILELNEVMTDL
ncbi:MAG TPA: hypothetical protein VJN18_08165 [Polyangiaceae bacterium]|nr:hypothetical protein [Polyangiaceae bacterium]